MPDAKVIDFLRAYATAMLVWQHVESAMFSTFFTMFNVGADPDIESNQKRLGAIFYSQDTFGAKVKIVDALAKVRLRGELLAEWEKLRDKALKAYGDRNILAHHTAVAKNTESTDLDLVMAPAMFVPDEIRRKRKGGKVFDAEGCQRLVNEFHMIAGQLDEFSQNKIAKGRYS